MPGVTDHIILVGVLLWILRIHNFGSIEKLMKSEGR